MKSVEKRENIENNESVRCCLQHCPPLKGHGSVVGLFQEIRLKFFEDFWCVFEHFLGFPCIAFRAVSFPFDQVLAVSFVESRVQDGFDFVFFFVIDFLSECT